MPIEIFDCTLKKVFVKYFVYEIIPILFWFRPKSRVVYTVITAVQTNLLNC